MKTLPHDPVIISSYRSAIGRYGGKLSAYRPDDLLAFMLKQVVKISEVDEQDIDEVIVGCANQAGEDNRNIARMAVLLAGLDRSIPAITLNRLCASGLDAIIDGARRIITGEAQMVIAGGVESMSRAPYVLGKPESPFRLGPPQVYDSSLGWRFYNQRMSSVTEPEHNGVTAERLAERYSISRLRQDRFSLRSHKRAVKSQEDGFFAREIVPLAIDKKAGKDILDKDEGPRPDTSIEKLSSLKPVFLEAGTITAGNSSSLNDGAAVSIITSHEYAKTRGLIPKARILGFASAGVDPKIMGFGPVPATKKLLKYSNLAIDDFSAIEINEAFAAQVLAVTDALSIDEEKVNDRGGAIALGHPLGCSGARIVSTLINHMHDAHCSLGLVSLCVGVGQGVSMAIEAL